LVEPGVTEDANNPQKRGLNQKREPRRQQWAEGQGALLDCSPSARFCLRPPPPPPSQFFLLYAFASCPLSFQFLLSSFVLFSCVCFSRVSPQLVHEVLRALRQAGVALKAGPRAIELGLLSEADRAESLSVEYGDKSCLVEVVPSMEVRPTMEASPLPLDIFLSSTPPLFSSHKRGHQGRSQEASRPTLPFNPCRSSQRTRTRSVP